MDAAGLNAKSTCAVESRLKSIMIGKASDCPGHEELSVEKEENIVEALSASFPGTKMFMEGKTGEPVRVR